ncbi:MAG: ABC-2 transporter permease [Clostridiaceae bacterium]|nr:ABC-2 transporter permease [Clostridiaceae bacterium]
MYSLIVKDILIQKKRMLISFLLIIFMIISFQSIGEAMFAASVGAFTYSLLMVACAYEDMNKSNIMLNSLPIKKSKIVAAKYVSIFVFFIMGTIIYYVCHVVASITKMPFTLYPLSFEMFVGGLASVCLMQGIYLPIFFKVGYVKSKILNFIIFFTFFYGISYLITIIQRDTIIPWINRLNEFIQVRGQVFSAMILLGVITVFILASYSLSVKFYKQREF